MSVFVGDLQKRRDVRQCRAPIFVNRYSSFVARETSANP